MNKIINMRVEYEVRHLAVECPCCKRWFRAVDMMSGISVSDMADATLADYNCPGCNVMFEPHSDGYAINITEERYPDVYKDCIESFPEANKEIIGKVVLLKNGSKGKVMCRLESGESKGRYLLGAEKGCRISESFSLDDIISISDLNSAGAQ